jgi:hypothetical protein
VAIAVDPALVVHFGKAAAFHAARQYTWGISSIARRSDCVSSLTSQATDNERFGTADDADNFGAGAAR